MLLAVIQPRSRKVRPVVHKQGLPPVFRELACLKMKPKCIKKNVRDIQIEFEIGIENETKSRTKSKSKTKTKTKTKNEKMKKSTWYWLVDPNNCFAA